MLDSSKARALLGWRPRWTLERALQAVVEWYKAYENLESLRDVVMQQISSYESLSCRGASEPARMCDLLAPTSS
jgi:dTDP-D-glucose 4,6-dehydratase